VTGGVLLVQEAVVFGNHSFKIQAKTFLALLTTCSSVKGA
jgi:hypothetical protein